MSDVLEVPDGFLESASDVQLLQLASQLGVLTAGPALNGNQLRALLQKQEMKS
jgi:hypothetical protein